jgi:hypothetical protein
MEEANSVYTITMAFKTGDFFPVRQAPDSNRWIFVSAT